MKMIGEVRVRNFPELHESLAKYRETKSWIFRGQADKEWKLVPKIGRSPYERVIEREVFQSWKRRAVEFVSMRIESDWDWLAIAQHHGLVTRLLDWTTNPMNAAFFAVREERKGDAYIFAANIRKESAPLDLESDPYDFQGVAIFRPRGVVPRITRQGGLFTIHGTPTDPLDISSGGLKGLDVIVIEEAYRLSLLSELSFYGVNSATLFPDLDGLSAFVNWSIRAKEYWKFSEA